MRSPQALAEIDAPVGTSLISADEVIRTLLEFTSSPGPGEGYDRVGENRAEEILVDTEVDGARYLLIRMPRLNRLRVQLSPREKEIGRMVAKGHPNKVIADVLNISTWTVCTHLRRMFAKMGVGSRAAMVAQILESEVFSSDHRIPSDLRPRTDLGSKCAQARTASAGNHRL